MVSRFMAFAALALACIVAAGGGAYLAVRQNAQPPASVSSQPVAQQSAAQGAPAAVVSTPPAPADSSPSATSPEPAKPTADTTIGSAAPVPQPPKPGRHPKTERARPSDQMRVSDDAAQAVPQGDGHLPNPANGNVEPLQTQVPPPQPVNPAPLEPQREWVDVTVPAESVLGLQVQTAVSSETARVEDRVEARVTRDMRIGDRVAIPAGTQALGTVVQVERGGKMKTPAHFAIRFNTLILPDGNRVSLNAEAVHREGPSPANKTAAKIGGATVGGAILGAILGGGKGAAIGGAIGAGGGTAASMAGDREPATLPAGSVVNIRLMSPVTVTLDR